MRRWIIAAMGVGLIATACSKKSSDTTGPGGGSGSAVSTEQAVANMVAGGVANPAFLTPGNLMNMGGGAMLAGTKQGFCEGVTTGDTTDADGDRVPVDATWSVDCDTTYSYRGRSFHIILQGAIQGTDMNDNDPWVGRVSISNPNVSDDFFHYFSDASGVAFHLWFKGFSEATHTGNTYGVQTDLSYRVQVGDTTYGTVRYAWDASFTSQNTGWNPGDGLTDGDLTLNGSIDYTTPEGSTIQGMTTETLTPIHYDSGCQNQNGDIGPTSGEIRVTWSNGANVLVLTITGCNQFQATYNGQSFAVNPVGTF